MNKKITDENIDDILDTAFTGGISYWCDLVDIVMPKGSALDDNQPEMKYMSEALTHGGVVKLTAEGTVYTLTRAKFERAIKTYNGGDTSQFDAEDADNIVQLAIFGKLVYS